MFTLFSVLLTLFSQPEKMPTHTQSELALIPDKMMFCDVEITLTPEVKATILAQKKKLYEAGPYFNAAVARGDTYLPFIEEALQERNMPDDLKYMAMQESNLFADAISSSNAVGFWQFKSEAASESGLKMNTVVDERKHIYRSSVGAATMLSKINKDFDNWLYTIIGYYEGNTGAIKHTNPMSYGEKTMVIDQYAHWYLIKTIAYKLTYEDPLKITLQPNIWLEPFSAKGPITVKELAKKHNISEAEWVEWNKWLSGGSIPAGETYTYYIPHKNQFYKGHIADPSKPGGGVIVASTPTTPPVTQPSATVPAVAPPVVMPAPTPTPTPATQPAAPLASNLPEEPVGKNIVNPVSDLALGTYAEIQYHEDVSYGIEAEEIGMTAEYVLYDGSKLLADLALELHRQYSDLLIWNDIFPGNEPKKNTLIYLQNPKKSAYHIVRKGETMSSISAFHGTSVRKLQKKNRMDKRSYALYEGQKLYLKKKRPQNEKIIILSGFPKSQSIAATPPPVVQPTAPAVSPTPVVTPAPPKPLPVPPAQPSVSGTVTPAPAVSTPKPATTSTNSRWVEHTVKEWETLWSISIHYQTKPDIIKLANNMTTDDIAAGQVLQVFTTQKETPSVYDPAKYSGSHTITKGETLNAISKLYNMTLDELIQVNKLPSSNIKIGQVLIVKK